MSLLEFHADLKRTAEGLERIAVALERIAGPLMDDEPYVPKRTQPQDIGRTNGGERAALSRLHELEKKMDQ